MVKLQCHSYCKECFSRLVSTAAQNEQQWPPKCCLNEIPIVTVLKNADGDLRTLCTQRFEEWRIPVADRVYCHEPTCSIWLKPDQINRDLRIVRCTRGHWTCVLCRGAQHDRDECPQDRDMTLTNELAEEEGWKRCFNCHALVEHREACQHMTCRCGTEFCYVCCARWRTCACTMEQLEAIKQEANTRRDERAQREADDAAELREILREIEKFEKNEAILREETEKLEEERRQRELEERMIQESIRREEVEVRYRELRATLEELHDLQQILVECEQEEEEKSLAAESIKVRGELREKQDSAIAAKRADMEATVAEKTKYFNEDYVARVAAERKLEEEYQQQLEKFYDGQAGGEERAQEAMTQYKRKMDKGWRTWSKWRKATVDELTGKLQDEIAMKEEVMFSIRNRLSDSYAAKEADRKKRKIAELTWVQLVIVERERLLAEMEVEELDDGDEDWFSVSSGDNAVEDS
jgi:hypothetical protein